MNRIKSGRAPRVIARCVFALAVWFVAAAGVLADDVHFLVIGDWGGKESMAGSQRGVAKAMARYIADQNIPLSAVLLLGDNVYGDLSEGDEAKMNAVFEERYPAADFGPKTPFYPVMGNHDCEDENSHLDMGKVRMELAYARINPRFAIPSRDHAEEARRTYYKVDFLAAPGDAAPRVTLLGLDSNWHYLKKFRDAQGTSRGWLWEKEWLAQELKATATTRRWVVAMAHFPMVTNGCHQENTDVQMVRQHWLGLWKLGLPASQQHPAPDFYLCGHNHNLEHLREPAATTTTFLTSGGGGGDRTYALRNHRYGPFSRKLYGFVHLRFGAEEAEVKIFGVTDPTTTDQFPVVHAFRRSLKTGEVTVTTPGAPLLDPIGDCGHMQ